MTELELRLRAFHDELWADQRWDSEFTMSPHSPSEKMSHLVALGPLVVPTLVGLCGSKDRDARFHAILGLRTLGAACGPEGLAALEALATDPDSGSLAIEVLASLQPERFWALRLYEHREAVRGIARSAQEKGSAAAFVDRLLGEGAEKALGEAVEALSDVAPGDAALIEALQRVQASSFPKARARALHLLSKLPGASSVEAMIEAAVLSERVPEPLIDRAAGHPESLRLVDVLVRSEWTAFLARLLQRRLQAGLATPSERVRPLIERKLRHPKREWRYEQHEVHDAAEAALYLGDPALIPALVDAVIPANTGYAWEPLVKALTSFGAGALAAVEERLQASSDPETRRWLESMCNRLRAPQLPRVELGDAQFISGSIDHTTGGAFTSYAEVLRVHPSAHAAFQLAWIDRAFGVPIGGERLRFVRALGFRDEELLEALARPVTPLEGGRHQWRKCDAADAVRVAAAGLPGLAFLGSRDPKHAAGAEAHVERVRAACNPPLPRGGER